MSSSAEGQRRIVTVLVVLATIIGFFAVFAVWAKRQLLDSDNWANTSSKLLEDQDIRDATAGFLVDSLYANTDVEAQLQTALPPRAQPLAAPISGALREVATRVTTEALSRPAAQKLWEEANRRASERLIQVVEGGDSTVSTANGDVTLDLSSVLSQVGGQAGVTLSQKVPPDAGQIVIMRSDQLSGAQDLVNVLRKLAYILPFLALFLYGLAIYLAHGRRRETLRAAGFGFISIGIGVLIVLKLAGGVVVGALTSTASVEGAAQSTWDIGTSMLHAGGVAMLGYGIAIVLGAWLAGPGKRATSVRRQIAPVLHSRGTAYLALAAIVALILWWNPTPGTSQIGTILVLIALLVAGLEALRAQTLNEFPDR